MDENGRGGQARGSLAVIAVYAALVAFHLLLSRGMSNPVIQPDEGSYFGIAHFLAFGTGLAPAYHEAQHNPGYSLLLLPVELIARDPLAVYRAALILNSFLLSSVMPACFVLTGELWPESSVRRRLVTASLVSLYPAFVVSSNVAMSTNLFVPLFMATCAATARACRLRNRRSWWVAGFLSASLVAVSPVGLTVMLALLVVALAGRRPFAARAEDSVPLLAGMQTAALPVVILTRAVSAAPRSAGQRTRDVGLAAASRTAYTGRHVWNAIHQGQWMSKLSELAGQVFYLTIGTYGLFVVGLIVGATALKRVLIDGSEQVTDRIGAATAVAIITTIGASSLTTNAGGGPLPGSELLIFGRYNESVLGPVLLLGLWTLADSRLGRRPRSHLGVGIGAVAVVSGMLLLHGRSAGERAGPTGPIDVLALHLFLAVSGRIDVPVLLVAGLAVSASLILLARKAGTAGLCLALTPLFVASGIFSASRLAGDSARRNRRGTIASAITVTLRHLPGVSSCIGFEATGGVTWYVDNDAFLLPGLAFEQVSPGSAYGPCTRLVISGSDDLPARVPGAQLLAREAGVPLTLWLLPAPPSESLGGLGTASVLQQPKARPHLTTTRR